MKSSVEELDRIIAPYITLKFSNIKHIQQKNIHKVIFFTLFFSSVSHFYVNRLRFSGKKYCDIFINCVLEFKQNRQIILIVYVYIMVGRLGEKVFNDQ